MRLISFIIPAWNEESVLGATLKAVHTAAAEVGVPYEVIVADDDSTDRTAEIAREGGARVVGVRNRQISATRNDGAKEAKGDLLVFVDADTIINEAVVKAAVAAVDGGAVGGGCVPTFDGRIPLYARVFLGTLVPIYRLLGIASGCFIFCTREAFDAVGGFDQGLYAAEEGAMSMALRRRGRFVVLRETVVTSGRKLRTHSAREVLAPFLRIAVSGRSMLRRREGLDIWYGTRRADGG